MNSKDKQSRYKRHISLFIASHIIKAFISLGELVPNFSSISSVEQRLVRKEISRYVGSRHDFRLISSISDQE